MPIFGKKKKEPVEEIQTEYAKPLPTPPIFEKNIAVEKLMKSVQVPGAESMEQEQPRIQQPKTQSQPAQPTQPIAYFPPISHQPKIFRAEPKMQFEQKPVAVRREVEEQEDQEQEPKHFAPLFVKIDRYREILNAMNSIKSTLVMIKNTFNVMNELEKLRAENSRVVQEAIEKVDKKILTLDSEFLRPSGFIEEAPELHDIHGLQSTIMDLRSQIDQMKSELRELH